MRKTEELRKAEELRKKEEYEQICKTVKFNIKQMTDRWKLERLERLKNNK